MQVKDCLQVRSNTLIRYNKYPRKPLSALSRTNALSNFYSVDQDTGEVARKAYSGTLCQGAKKRLTRVIENLVLAAEPTYEERPNGKILPFHLSFMTLTVHNPDRNLTSKEVQETCLEHFLQWLRRRYIGCLYIWKAELQKRGQIHYHITSNCFVDRDLFAKKWNELQQKAGYLDEYYKAKGHYNAPSVDITSVRKIKNITGYLTKRIAMEMPVDKKGRFVKIKKGNIVGELAKTMQNQKTVGGKVWDCSKNLKEYGYFTSEVDGETAFKINQSVKNGDIEEIRLENCTVYRTKEKPTYSVLSFYSRLLYDEHMTCIRLKEKPQQEKIELPIIKRKIKNMQVRLDLFSSS